MPELAAGFQSLPAEYQTVIRLAQDHHNVAVTPLQALAGGWSGAMVYLVSVQASDRLQHFVLKLDRKNAKSQSDEVRRHETALRQSPPSFAEKHLAQMVLDRAEADGAMAIFYSIAGQSLYRYRTLSSYEKQSQIEAIFAASYQYLLSDWNAMRTFNQAVHPSALLDQWLSFRLKPDGHIQKFLETYCNVPPDIGGFLVQGDVLPNPLAYARHQELWGASRSIDVAMGLQHGDLNTNNILIKFAKDDATLDGYFLIDFALFKEHMPLVFDLRYLEMSYLILRQAQMSFTKLVDLILRFGEADVVDPQQVPLDVAGLAGVISSTRREFERWVEANHPSLHDDLWGQYWLAGVAAGLSYCHKPDIGQPQRMIGLIYAAANLKRYSQVFGVSAPTEARQLYDPVKLHRDRTMTITMRGVPHNLPAQATTLIGREAEVKAIHQLLTSSDTRLITLSGPGGVGKTRLSLEVATRVGNAFPDGVFFIPLADITDPTLVASKLAQMLDIREGGNQPLIETLKDFLQRKRMLLILDNFEHLMSATPMVAELLAASSRLKLLVSSRIMLEVRGEYEFVVPPLETPNGIKLPDLKRLGQYQSVQLFVERAHAANSKFSLTAENAAAVVEICQRLDGLPLAIELAAARIKLLSPQAMLSRLGNRLALLTGGARDLPVRQQTLRNSLDLSYSLLQPEEQVLFARLGVFVGGFTLEIAESICNAGDSMDVLEGVTSLTNNSLLHSNEGLDGQPRFRMLETIREYALERLAERGELITAQEMHTEYYFNKLKVEIGDKLYKPEAPMWMNWIESEYTNIAAALAWGFSASDPSLPRICMLLAWYWYRRGYMSEGRAWSQRLLASPLTHGRDRTLERALALVTDASLAMWQGDLKAAEANTCAGMELAQRAEDPSLVAWSFLARGVLNINMGNYIVAYPFIKDALALYEAERHSWFSAIALVHLGNIELGLGNPIAARERLDEAYAISGAWSEDWTHTFVLNNLGEVARTQGDYEAARHYYEDSEALLRAMGDKGDLARLLHNLGYVAQHEGNTQKAEAQFQESLAMFRTLGNKRGIAECLLGLAGLRAVQGQATLAAQLLGAAEATMAAVHAGWWPADRGELKRNREAIHAQMDEATFAAELAKGEAMPLEQAIASVTR